ncbi:helicase HerA-like domain-containing protein [Photobacterium sp. GB-1]|uniref:helicase HerA-like domain-containing protein n=1 Tax=Photobacterium sp. GB-1 TaxID=2022111 RepID=UPI000D15E2A2|nr:helicase HerA-like domain-containing protein [Photobacterium sp. GB-1]PSV51483.1 ATP-binding protein [Photobacterium sp. GB-1]
MKSDIILIGKGENKIGIHPKYANRHGFIAGATGTGKTVTLQCLAEGFSSLGVPVFLADVKGDLSGMAKAGTDNAVVQKRCREIGIDDFQFTSFPVEFWDLFGKEGAKIRATLEDMGPLLLSRLLDCNDVQEGLINLAFEYAEENQMPMLDLDDFSTALNYLGDNSKQLGGMYGRISKSSIAAIERRLLGFKRQGGSEFFGEPALDYHDFMKTAADGRGIINILDASTLIQSPKLYSTFLLWLLSELYENLPEVGDLDKPKFVFFFDEAHLLFDDVPKVFLDQIEQVVRLIRSKSVGIYFVSQNPTDIPDSVLGQLGNRIQHALRAYTPKERKAVKVAAESFRDNPNLDVVTLLGELGVGEALVSVLEEGGVPSVVEHVTIRPPESQIGPIRADKRIEMLNASQYFQQYKVAVNRESAHEILNKRTEQKKQQTQEAEHDKQERASIRKPRRSQRQTYTESFIKTLLRQLANAIVRALFKRR